MLYKAYSAYLQEKYGAKVYKLPINLPVTCPNRDGTLGREGCAFCGPIGTGYESLPSSMSVREQITQNKAYIAQKYKAKKFIPYFQNFSNTYLPLPQLAAYLEEAVTATSDIAALAIATRADCLNDAHLALLEEIRNKYSVDITVELGLQTVNYHSLAKINRAHTLAEFIDAVFRLKRNYPAMRVCAQMILNLPWDNLQDSIEGAKILSALQVDEVKLHALYVVKNTLLAKWYETGAVSLRTKEDYIENVIAFLEHLRPETVIGRLIGRAPAADTLFANWQSGWWKIQAEIEEKMRLMDTWQGKKCDYLNGRAVRHF
ncbi:MAG: TIGR01212 family radical SAM protein [Sporomusaceae bacterium]|jgi:radical SAM protein (TIGR01212 family)|nr:TIGR01212 family radical SAM protein [Sporomusaceae bacterium]